LIEFIKNLFTKSIIDLENPRIFKTVIISVILTLLLASIIFILFYYVLFASLFQLADPNNFEEGGVMAFILSLKVISYILGILQFFISWLLVSLILVPVGTIISGLFAENIFFAVRDLNKYKWKYELKKNSFLISIQYAVICAIRSFFVNILILPLYLILPVANIFIFVFVNAYLVGREYCGNFLIQFFDKTDVKRNFMLLDGKIYFIGLFVVFLYTIPILNLVAPIIGNIFTSHLILGNKLIIKKNRP
jgi:hypothetical protein